MRNYQDPYQLNNQDSMECDTGIFSLHSLELMGGKPEQVTPPGLPGCLVNDLNLENQSQAKV